MTDVPIAEDLFTDEPRLIGGTCDDCGTISFPLAAGCPRCSSASVRRTELATAGTLWTWTSQEFRPPDPYLGPGDAKSFERHYVGYVELPGQLRVEGLLTGFDREPVIGEEVVLVTMPFGQRASGEQVRTYAFAPTGGQ